jgi:hypothetical protein
MPVATVAMVGNVPALSFLEFRAEGIVLRAVSGNALTPQATLQNLELMVEVSQYPFAG